MVLFTALDTLLAPSRAGLALTFVPPAAETTRITKLICRDSYYISIISYDGGNIPVLGTVKIQVWRGSFTCLLLCRLVESRRCRPILGKSACEGMGVVKIKDSDAIWRPHTSGGQVVSVEDVMSSSKPLTKEQVIEMFPDVFDEGEYHIRLND